MGILVAGNARGVFNASAKTLAFAIPATARKGDALVAIVAHNAVDSLSTPAGWSLLVTAGSPDRFSLFARMLDDLSPFSFPLATTTNEWQGEVVVVRGASPASVREAGSFSTFTATTSPVTPSVTSQQAINLILSMWSVAGAPALTLPAGFTAIDNFASAVVSSRSLMVGYRLAGTTGALTFPAATASPSATGTAITQVLRERVPPTPAALIDLVPGNIGLLGKDTRPAR